MLKIQVGFLSVLAKIAGTREMLVDLGARGTLGDLMSELGRRLGAGFREKVLHSEFSGNPFVLVFVNGVDNRNAGGLATVLKDGDRVEFVPAIAGG